MKKNTPPLFADTFYHIYNRGINKETLFKSQANSRYFLQKAVRYICPIAHIYAYSLLGNHFHFLLRTKSEAEILLNIAPKKERPVPTLISLQFSHLFNGYTQAINKMYDRTGGLFENPFRRKEVNDESHLRYLLFYIHYNPEKHKFCDDFTSYQYSSYQSILANSQTFIERDRVLEMFGSKISFADFHRDLRNLQRNYL